MLIAVLNGKRIYAEDAERGLDYRCPSCGEKVHLKKGAVRTPHFSHYSNSDCDWGGNQSEAHLRTKKLIYEHFLKLKTSEKDIVELEYPLGDANRIADIYLRMAQFNWQPIAIEIQKTPISREEISIRTDSYFRTGVAVLWIVPATKKDILKKCQKSLAMFRPSDYERWIHGFNFNKIFFFNYEKKNIIEAKLEAQERWIEETDFGGGYWKTYKQYKKLNILQKYPLDDAKFRLHWRDSFERGGFVWPRGYRVDICNDRSA